MKPYHLFLAALMLVTGSINTITTKFADITCAKGVEDYNRTFYRISVATSIERKNVTGPMSRNELKSNIKNVSDWIVAVNTTSRKINITEHDVSGVVFPDEKAASVTESFGPEGGYVIDINLSPQFSRFATELVANNDAAGPLIITVNSHIYTACTHVGPASGNGTAGKCVITMTRIDHPYSALPGNNDCARWTPDEGQEHLFDHPFVQAGAMFIGEFMCLVVFTLVKKCAPNSDLVAQGKNEDGTEAKEISPLWWAIPALCDCCATSTMYVGLTLTYASSFQMLRGAVIIFTGIASILILRRKLRGYHWGGMVVVLLGLICVGAAAFFGPPGSAKNQVLGDVLIIAAQVIVALQMVVEEKIMLLGKTPALKAVGYEGLFGCIYITIFCIIFNFTPGPRAGIVVALIGTVCSIALFNYSGLSVTKEMSATTRMVLDSLRTIVIWVFGLIAIDDHTGVTQHWETFDAKGPGFLQLVGFIFLLTGSALYNEREIPGKTAADGNPEKEPLLYPLLRSFGCMGPAPTDVGSERAPLLRKGINTA